MVLQQLNLHRKVYLGLGKVRIMKRVIYGLENIKF